MTGRRYKDHLVSNTPEVVGAFCIEVKGKIRFKFWQSGGGFDRNLWNAKPIYHSIEYIENNPVRAGFVSKSDEWRWSSAWARKRKCGLLPDELNIPMFMKP
jgi:putative transposase